MGHKSQMLRPIFSFFDRIQQGERETEKETERAPSPRCEHSRPIFPPQPSGLLPPLDMQPVSVNLGAVNKV